MEAVAKEAPGGTTLFLCGDVMSGRGIDQILPRSLPPRLDAPEAGSAKERSRSSRLLA